jgi:tetratricopeptide (TPR) repeat protein
LATVYSNLAGVLETLGRGEEAEAALRAGLAVDARHAFLNLQWARRLAARGDHAEALRHLERAAADWRPRPRGQPVLVFAQDAHFDAIRHDPRFQRVILRAAAA